MQASAFPRFSLIHFFWVISLIAAALARFGGGGGIAMVVGVFIFWFGAWRIATGRNTCSEAVITLGVVWMLSTVLLFPAMRGSGRGPAMRTQCQNNLKCIQLGLLNYESANGSFPPPFIADDTGKPMHSWRVLILPYVEHQALYDKYNFDEPWDSPSNVKLLDEIPDIYDCPSHDDGLCRYLAVTGEDSAWRVDDPVRLAEITNGSSKCVLVSETLKGVPWTKPEDITPDEFLETAIERAQSDKHGGHITRRSGRIAGQSLNVGYADGHVQMMQVPQQAHWLEQLSRRSGEREQLTTRDFEPRATRSSAAGWVLLVLCLMPMVPTTKCFFNARKIDSNKH